MFKYFLMFLQCFVNLLIGCYFLSSLFTVRRTNKWIDVTILTTFALITASANSFGNPIVNLAVATISFVLASILIYSAPTIKLFFAGFIVMSLSAGSELISTTIEMADATSGLSVTTTSTNLFYYFFSSGIFIVIVFTVKWLLQKFGLIKTENARQMNLILFPLPLLSVLIIYFVLAANEVSDMNPKFIILGMVINIGLLFVNVLVFLSDTDNRKKYEYRAMIAEINMQATAQETLIKQQDQNSSEMNALVHDFKNQLLTLQAMLVNNSAENESRGVKDYIDQTLIALPKTEMFTYISSCALRSILLNTYNECERLDITFTHEIEFTDFDFMAYIDICAIFSNILDNAIYACKEMCKQGFPAKINLQIKKMNHLVSIELKNDKINTVIESDDRIMTTKRDNAHHGIGILNVKRAIGKYGGTIDFSHTETEFLVEILLNID